MRIKYPIALILFIFITLTVFQSCSWDRRRNLQLQTFASRLNLEDYDDLVVYFEPAVEDKRLDETVWDNTVGAFWDVQESQKIGFTQHYQKQFYLIPPVALPTAAKAGVHLVDSRIVIPFGRILSYSTASALQQQYPDLRVCYTLACLENKEAKNYLKINIGQFLVWEEPLNHLNLYAKYSGQFFIGGRLLDEYHGEKISSQHKLGGVLNTHNSMISKMNSETNQFAEDIVSDLLSNLLAAN